jgi:hypothetical protein
MISDRQKNSLLHTRVVPNPDPFLSTNLMQFDTTFPYQFPPPEGQPPPRTNDPLKYLSIMSQPPGQPLDIQHYWFRPERGQGTFIYVFDDFQETDQGPALNGRPQDLREELRDFLDENKVMAEPDPDHGIQIASLAVGENMGVAPKAVLSPVRTPDNIPETLSTMLTIADEVIGIEEQERKRKTVFLVAIGCEFEFLALEFYCQAKLCVVGGADPETGIPTATGMQLKLPLSTLSNTSHITD